MYDVQPFVLRKHLVRRHIVYQIAYLSPANSAFAFCMYGRTYMYSVSYHILRQ